MIESLNELSIPVEEIVSFTAQKVGISYCQNDLTLRHQLLLAEDIQQNTFLLSSIMRLLTNELAKRRAKVIYDPAKTYHPDIFCAYCSPDREKFLEGARLKCLNCTNFNICESKGCYEQHRKKFPSHHFVYIERPLPLVPEHQAPGAAALHPLQAKPFVLGKSSFHTL